MQAPGTHKSVRGFAGCCREQDEGQQTQFQPGMAGVGIRLRGPRAHRLGQPGLVLLALVVAGPHEQAAGPAPGPRGPAPGRRAREAGARAEARRPRPRPRRPARAQAPARHHQHGCPPRAAEAGGGGGGGRGGGEWRRAGRSGGCGGWGRGSAWGPRSKYCLQVLRP